MANFLKCSDPGGIGHLCKHYAREVIDGHYFDDEHIDHSKTYLNYNLAPEHKDQFKYMQQKIEEVADGKTVRKDAVKMCVWCITKPRTLDLEKERDFFQESYNFVVNRYGSRTGMGEDCVISAFIHKDEPNAQPHMHFTFIPVLKRKDGRQSLCAKDLINRKELQIFHRDLENYLVEKGICRKGEINSGITKAQGGNLTRRELKARSAYEREQRERADRERTVSRWDFLSRNKGERNRDERN